MFIEKNTQKTFQTRKEAKQVLGHAEFNRLAKAQQIIFIPTKTSSALNYEQLHTNSK